MADGPIVCDTGPLIALSLIDQLDLLRGLYRGVVVPRTVLDEATAGGADRPLLDSMVRKGYFLSQRLVERATSEAGEASDS